MFASKKLRVTKVGANNNNNSGNSAATATTRRDIKCGFRLCRKCYKNLRDNNEDDANNKTNTSTNDIPGEASPCLDLTSKILIPDSSSALADIAVYEHASMSNIILLSSVIAAVKEGNRATHARWMTLVNDPTKKCYVFSNDFHYATQTTARATDGSESQKEYQARVVKVAASWFASHLELGSTTNSENGGGDDQALKNDAQDSTTSTSSSSSSSLGPFLLTNSLELYSPSSSSSADSAAPVQQQLKNGLKILTLHDFIVEAFGQDAPLLEHLTTIAGTGKEETGFQKFEPHLELSRINAGVSSGEFFVGKMRASDSSPFYGELRGACVATALAPILPPNATKDGSVPLPRGIAVPGKRNMNRAFHDDQVAARLHPIHLWRAPMGKSSSSNNNKDDNNNKDVPSSPIEAIRKGWLPTAEVVGLVSTDARRSYCGSIDSTDGDRGAGTDGMLSVLFQPKSSKFPKIRLQTRHLNELRGKRLTVKVDDWPETSAYPRGHYVDVLGPIGDRDTEATVILLENDVPHYDFSKAVYDCLPQGEWNVEPEQEKIRTDYRHISVCSVDPLGCRDIDDALHYREVKGKPHLCEIGVHIADVTHFVKEGSALDEEARKRCTSVYLVDRRINMLPQLLTENLCSIVADQDRYAFSVVWEFEKKDLEDLEKPLAPVSEVFSKSIIRSRAALYYGDAQKMIDDPNDSTELTESLRGLMRFAKRLKRDRDAEGALTLGGQEFKFKIDNDHLNPTDMHAYKTFETNSMVEEWMLLANACAAKKCFDTFPAAALLRRHEAPSTDAFETLNAALIKRGVPPLLGGTSKALNFSLNTALDTNDPFFNKLVRILTTRCLRQAQYFSTGDVASFNAFKHFGLAMGLYTHFTSPIRRYADVVVHRQLACAIGVFTKPSEVEVTNGAVVTKVADVINYRHEMAQKAGRDSQNLFTGFYLRNFQDGNIPIEQGYVTRVTDSDVNVFVAKYGQEGRVPIETLPVCYQTNGGAATNLDVFSKTTVRIKLLKEGDVMGVKLGFEILDPSVVEDEKKKEKANPPELKEDLEKEMEQKLEEEAAEVNKQRGVRRERRE